MSNSLADQLLKAGLIDEKKAKKAKKSKHQQQKQEQHGKAKSGVDAGQRAKQARAQEAARARELNRIKNEKLQLKDVKAQIRHLIELNRVEVKEGEIAFNFTHAKKVKHLYVDEAARAQLLKGSLAIVCVDGKFDMVPRDIADKIAERERDAVVLINDADEPIADDDPYAEFKVPDDLMW